MNDKEKAAYNEMATAMDKRDKYLFDLLEWYKKHGSIPDASGENIEHHRESFEAFKKDRFKSWRSMPKVVKRIHRAAKKSVKAPGLKKLTEQAHSD